MKRKLGLAVLVVVASLSSVRPVGAGIIDWMQEWSGPGPFNQRPFWRPLEVGNAMYTRCPKNFQIASVEAENRPCVFFDYRGLETPHDEDPQTFNKNFPYRATAELVDVGLSWRVRRSIEFGLGAGVMFASANEQTVFRPTLMPSRLLIEPAALAREIFVGLKGSGGPRNLSLRSTSWSDKCPLWHVVKFYVTGNVILGPLSGESFGVSGTNYDRRSEFVVSRGFIVDIGEFFEPLRQAPFSSCK